METHRPPSPDPPLPLAEVLAELIRSELPLRVALDTWCSRHGLRYSDVSVLIGKAPSAVSQWFHSPTRWPATGPAIAKLIGYQERARDEAA